MVIKVKIQMFKLNPMLKSNKALKLLLVEMKANSSMLMGFEIAKIVQNKQKYLIFTVPPTNELNELANSIYIIIFSHLRKIYCIHSTKGNIFILFP